MKRVPFDKDALLKIIISVTIVLLSVFGADRLSEMTVGYLSGHLAAFRTVNESTIQDTAENKTTGRSETEADSETVDTDTYETPEDIKKLILEYKEKYASAEKAGTVYESCYITKGATDSVGNVHIKNATAAMKPDFEALLTAKSDLKTDNTDEPVVLIFHTHTTESYLMEDNGEFPEGYETKSNDPARNMVRVGNAICEALEENSIAFIHDTEIYDEYYNGAYARSRVSVENYLRKYPSIKIVLDVHRDALYFSDTEHGKSACEINGKKAAQIMIITGAEDSGITDFPDWEYNLRFALEVQKRAMDKYYGLMKPVFFCPRRYNMNTAHCSLLLEFGTDANTLDEAVYSGKLMGEILSDIIKDHICTEENG